MNTEKKQWYHILCFNKHERFGLKVNNIGDKK